MKNAASFLTRNSLIVFFVVFIVFSSCKKTEDAVAPQLPPECSFVADFSDFNSQKLTASNWTFAAANVGFWNVFITVGLAVPVASYVEAFNHDAVQISSDTWQWSYSFTAVVSYTAKLNGKITSTGVEWEMYISKAGAYDNFLWYKGFSSFDRTNGTWTLYENPANAVQLLGIVWHQNTDGTADIQYTNIKEGDVENGGYIKYGLQIGDYDAFYKIFNKGQDNLTQIEWNRTSKAGFVIDPKHFGDSEKHCWDSSLQDVTCPM